MFNFAEGGRAALDLPYAEKNKITITFKITSRNYI